jgi:Collagen triple helix repeat (20 copies)
MFSPLRNRFGIPGVISVIALVFAMLGGAYAASNDSGSGKATASAKAKKGPRGPRGPQGPAGPVGPAGPQGPAGVAGANGLDGLDGAPGDDGDDGDDGTDGTSVANTEFSGAEGTCTEGGTKLVGTATTYACNGKKGADGEEGEKGDPWTVGGTLPPGKTETGVWALGRMPKVVVTCTVPETSCTTTSKVEPVSAAQSWFVPISFPIPLAASIAGANVHYRKVADTPSTECPGTSAEPKALPGHLCVYAVAELSSFTSPPPILQAGGVVPGASTAGAVITITGYTEGTGVRGTFAVTEKCPGEAPSC